MGNQCNDENLRATILGKSESEGFSYPEPENPSLRTVSIDQRYYLEQQKVAALLDLKKSTLKEGVELQLPYDLKKFTGGTGKAAISIREVMDNATAKDKTIRSSKGVLSKDATFKERASDVKDLFLGLWTGGRVHGNPSQVLGENIWNPIYQEEKALSTKYGGVQSAEYRAEYAKTIGKMAQGEIDRIKKLYIIHEPGSPQITEALAGRYKIEPEKVYDLVSYLDYIRDPFDGLTPMGGDIVNWAVGNLAGRQGKANLVWSFSNIGEMSRVIADYAPKKGGLQAVMAGFKQMITEGAPWQRRPDLEKQGLYGVQKGIETEFILENDNPFSWTNTMLVNFAHFTGQAFDGNGEKAVRESAFSSHYLDMPMGQRNIKSPLGRTLTYGLIRYPIHESIWYYNTLRKMIDLKDPAGAGGAWATMGIASLARAMWFGSAAAVPTPFMLLYNGVSKSLGLEGVTYEDFEQFDRDHAPMNLMGKTLGAVGRGVVAPALGAVGLPTEDAANYELNFGKWAQAGGGALFARAASTKDVIEQTGNSFGRAYNAIVERGDLGAAGLDLTAASITTLSMMNYAPWWAVNAQSAALFRKAATEYNGDNEHGKAVMGALFGAYNVRDKGMSNEEANRLMNGVQ